MEQAIPLLNDQEFSSDDAFLTRESHLSGRPRVNHWAKTKHLSMAILVSLLPTYIQPGRTTKKESLHQTAYLDALRGYAALIVFFYHSFPNPDLWLFQYPSPFRLIYRGGAGMVAIFYIISGYVLSYRMLKLMHAREPAKLLDSLASSTFRRWFRLYGSTGVATFIAMLCVWVGWYLPPLIERKETLWLQLWDWWYDFLYSSDPFEYVLGFIHDGAYGSHYLLQMWTIPVEFRGSIVLFTFCAAVCKMSIRSRWMCLWLSVLFMYYWRAVYAVEFLMGMFIADLSLLLHPGRLGRLLPQTEPGQKSTPTRHRHQRVIKLGCVCLVALGVYLLCQPDDFDFDREHPDMPNPWRFMLQHLSPKWYGFALYTFWLSFGAFFLVLGLENYPALQTPFNWSFSQYLGELSFGIYAMHILVRDSLFLPVLNPWRVKYLGEGLLAVWFIEAVATLCVLWLADYFTRADKLVVRLGKRIESATFQKWS
jgi:peptidoglycan/LPS O-acetylase OafA/YrhL